MYQRPLLAISSHPSPTRRQPAVRVSQFIINWSSFPHDLPSSSWFRRAVVCPAPFPYPAAHFPIPVPLIRNSSAPDQTQSGLQLTSPQSQQSLKPQSPSAQAAYRRACDEPWRVRLTKKHYQQSCPLDITVSSLVPPGPRLGSRLGNEPTRANAHRYRCLPGLVYRDLPPRPRT